MTTPETDGTPSYGSRNPLAQPTGDGLERSKFQSPALRRRSLPRPRLLEWMTAKVQGRLIVIRAEAGYGKTTLLVDFSQRTPLRTLWFRVDAADNDLVTFVAYLVASGKEHLESFGDATLALLGAGTWTGRSDALVDSYLRDLRAFGPERTVLILDDFHLIDQSRDIAEFVSGLLQRADSSLVVVVATRRAPELPLGRLRVQGQVAELDREDLRFQTEETLRLFREVYGRDFEADAVADLSRRTEGWAASLQLVDAATRSMTQTEARSFIQGLTGAAGDVHDFLAEEVVDQLAPEEQSFVMRLAILATITEESARIATGVGERSLRKLLNAAERSGLLSRRGAADDFRFHPLVQQFLQARLVRSEGTEALAALHLRIASQMESIDWSSACWHYAAIERGADVRRVLSAATTRIMSSGRYTTASRYVAGAVRESAISALIMSRQALASHDLTGAAALARRAVGLAGVDDAALGNLVSVLIACGELEEARSLAATLREQSTDRQLRQVADVTVKLIESSVEGDLRAAASAAADLAISSQDAGATRYEAIGWLNAAEVWRAIGRSREALAAATQARDLLQSVESAPEAATATSVRAWAMALRDGLVAAREEFAKAEFGDGDSTAVEVLAEFALVEALYGDVNEAARLIMTARSNRASRSLELAEKVALSELAVSVRKGEVDVALDRLRSIRRAAFSAQPGRDGLRMVLEAHLAVIREDPSASEQVAAALARATDQGCEWLVPYCQILGAVVGSSGPATETALGNIAVSHPSALSPLAELVLARDRTLSPEFVVKITPEIVRFPDRWLGAIRAAAEDSKHGSRLIAARLLERIGTSEDVPRLRRIAKSLPSASLHRDLGRTLARRLAPRVFLEDQGRVTIVVNGVEVASRHVRRKVLALLCFLLTKPRFSAPRDEVLDNLWPDMAPGEALNSLNQTVYFLRRVFEPGFVEDLSPGYISHESELVWLDTELVSSRSALCSAAIAGLSEPPNPADVDRLAGLYRDRFALDFAYEEWAGAYRDTQHAAYLRAIEEAVRLDAASGHFQRGVELARKALAIDPGAVEVEEALLRLYRLEGAHAAAAEQYAHYSAALRNVLDVDPPPLEAF